MVNASRSLSRDEAAKDGTPLRGGRPGRGRRVTVPRIAYSSVVRAPRDAVAAFHDDPANLARLTPPGVRVSVLEAPAQPGGGGTVRLRIGKGPITFAWE